MSETIFECVVDADLFRRAQMAVSTEETRYYLNGVFIEPCPGGGAIITATDGAMLVSFRDHGGIVNGSGIVSLDKPMLAGLKTPRGSVKQRLLVVRLGKGRVGRALIVDQDPKGEGSAHERARAAFDEPGAGVVTAQFSDFMIDGTFPDWRRVLPAALSPEKPVPIFDVEKMAVLVRALSPKGSAGVVITPSGKVPSSEPLLVRADRGPLDGFGILMPIRTEAKPRPLPAWVATPKAKAKPVAEAA